MPVQCRVCGKTYSGSGAYSNLSQHLTRKHQHVLAALKNKNKHVFNANCHGSGSKLRNYHVLGNKVDENREPVDWDIGEPRLLQMRELAAQVMQE